MGSVYPDVHKDIQHPKVLSRGIHRNWEEERVQETVVWKAEGVEGLAQANISEKPVASGWGQRKVVGERSITGLLESPSWSLG